MFFVLFTLQRSEFESNTICEQLNEMVTFLDLDIDWLKLGNAVEFVPCWRKTIVSQ